METVQRWVGRTARRTGLGWILLAASAALVGQRFPSSEAVETGKISVDGRDTPYRIRMLPVSSFPALPVPVAEALTARGCSIPQTYEAKRPENVIHGGFERAGTEDWAVLCWSGGEVSLLVFLASGSPAEPIVLAQAAATERLQAHDGTGELGFNWGIDAASPKQVHDAQAGMAHRPPAPDHDCVADSVIDRRTVYHLYRNGGWERVPTE